MHAVSCPTEHATCRALAQVRHLQHMDADIRAREAKAARKREEALQQGAPPTRQLTPRQQAGFLKRLSAQSAKSTAIRCARSFSLQLV